MFYRKSTEANGECTGKTETIDKFRKSSESGVTSDIPQKPPMSKKKKGMIIGVVAVVAALAVIVGIVIPSTMRANDYDKALQLAKDGKYVQAEAIFKELSDKNYKDSASKVKYCENMITYNKAQSLLDDGKYYDAYIAFSSLGNLNFRDSIAKAESCVQPEPAQGLINKNSAFGSGVSLTIKLASGIGNRYIKVYDTSDAVIATAFVNDGGSITLSLPATTIKIKTAAGMKWFGETDMYGKEGVYQTQLLGNTSETTTLKSNYTYTLTLGGVNDGNVPTKSVGADDM